MGGQNKARGATHKDGTADAVMGRVGKDDELALKMQARARAREAADALRRERLAARGPEDAA